MRVRARLFRYGGLEVAHDSLTGHFQLDGTHFQESVALDGVGDLATPAVRAVAHLWYLIAGLSYYKAGAALRVDLDRTPVGPKGRALLRAAIVDGLGEFSYRNDLDLDDVVLEGGVDAASYSPLLDPQRVLTPFGGGIDSVVTVQRLAPLLEQTLFVQSPATGRFAALEDTAAVTGLAIVRASRGLDPQILLEHDDFFQGHVPVTAMVTLLACVAAVASGRGGVAMSNEHSSSAPNLRWHDRDVNHQWSKSWAAEELIGDAVQELIGGEFTVASVLRDRSELWVAQEFSAEEQFHHVFRSCNRAFTQDASRRAVRWCGECDKCLFIDLILAPFVSRSRLRDIFGAEPLADLDRADQLRTLVGLGAEHKPFECVGDPDESAVALTRVSAMDEWADVAHLGELARLTSPDRGFEELLNVQGPTRAPAHWLR
jgi:hypothetical protein